VAVHTEQDRDVRRERFPGSMTAPGRRRMPDAAAQDPFTRLARELSHNGGLIETLLATHPSEGDCRGCRLPDARVPITAPCSLRSLALLAASIRAAESTLRSYRG